MKRGTTITLYLETGSCDLGSGDSDETDNPGDTDETTDPGDTGKKDETNRTGDTGE